MYLAKLHKFRMGVSRTWQMARGPSMISTGSWGYTKVPSGTEVLERIEMESQRTKIHRDLRAIDGSQIVKELRVAMRHLTPIQVFEIRPM